MFCSAVSIGRRLNDWNTKPIRSRRRRVRASLRSEVISVPSSSIEPELTSSRPASTCSSVDLPEPEGPMIAVKAPRVMSRSTASSAVTVPAPLP